MIFFLISVIPIIGFNFATCFRITYPFSIICEKERDRNTDRDRDSDVNTFLTQISIRLTFGPNTQRDSHI